MTALTPPPWPHEIPENTARWIGSHRVDRLSLETEWQSADRWTNHLMMHSEKLVCRAPPDVFVTDELVRYSDSNRGILVLAPAVEHTIELIDKWKRTHKSEIAEYKRLREKFKGVDLGEDT